MFKYVTCVLLLPMALSNAFGQALDSVAAIVNESVITTSELNKEVQTIQQQYQASNQPLPAEKELRKKVLQRLIDVDLELQLAKQHKMSVDDTELNTTLTKIASEHQMTLEQMREAVIQQGMAWNKYRENIRKEILVSQLQQKAVAKDIRVTPEQVEDYLKTSYKDEKKAEARFHLQKIMIPLAEEPSKEQLNAALKKAQNVAVAMKKQNDLERVATQASDDDFTLEATDLGSRNLAELPDVFAKKVIDMQQGQVSEPIRTGNGLHLLQLVAIDGYSGKHEVTKTHARHILLRPANNMTSDEAKRQVNNLYQQLQSGKDFAAMAKQYSLDTVSAAKGGDLGWISPGELVPEVEKAVDSLKVHQISKPVKSRFGWHLIEVLERKSINDTDSYKRQQVRMILSQKKFVEAVENWQQHMRATAYIKIMDQSLA